MRVPVQFLDELHLLYRLGDWRLDNAYRNAVTRATALHAIDNVQLDIGELIAELWTRFKYREMSRADRNRFDQQTWFLRRIIEGWHLLDPAIQRKFRAHAIPPSTVAMQAVKALKALKALQCSNLAANA